MDEDLENLTAGTFSVTLTDANSCFETLGGLVVNPTNIVLSLDLSNALCFNHKNGAIDLTVSGGILPFEYDWSNGETSEDIDGLGAGNYTVVVTDNNDCFIEITGFINHPDALNIDRAITHVSCFELSNGAIDILPSGGTQPYQYLWSNGANSEDIDGVTAGEYSVEIVDGHGCKIDDSYIVTEPDLLTASLESPFNFHDHNVDFTGGNNGSIVSISTGGTKPYYYAWSNEATTKDISGLSSGVYTLYLTDKNGCAFEVSIDLSEPLMLELPTAFSPNFDKDNQTYFIRGVEAYPDNKLIVLNRWGNIVYTVNNYNNEWIGTHQNGNDLPDGTYFVILEIDNKKIIRNDFVELKRK